MLQQFTFLRKTETSCVNVWRTTEAPFTGRSWTEFTPVIPSCSACLLAVGSSAAVHECLKAETFLLWKTGVIQALKLFGLSVLHWKLTHIFSYVKKLWVSTDKSSRNGFLRRTWLTFTMTQAHGRTAAQILLVYFILCTVHVEKKQKVAISIDQWGKQ